MSNYQVREIQDGSLKSEITDSVLRALPDWFGIEESIVDYVKKSSNLPFWAVYTTERPVGFLSLLQHNPYTSEIYCMGILEEFHHHGMGRSLVQAAAAWGQGHGAEFLTVKTLDESRPDDGYARTRRFYHAMGFRPLEVFPTLWGEDNPCLFMVRSLQHTV